MKKYIAVLCFILTLIIVGCSNKEVHDTVEVFTIEVLSDTPNNEGLYVKTGYKKVNSITYFEKSNNLERTKLFYLEDYFDMDGKFLESVIDYSELEKNLFTPRLEKPKENKKKMNEPITILAPTIKEGQPGESTKLTEAESEQVRTHILEFIQTLNE
ncbi:hypothetical protein [Paenibacillus terrigena]|uniref:hypothetical protein n=1 Tax=Paenibacillus terrigena TaxID=369333 RepID=UPI00036FCA32|nr:hypothetical protein [Paenibacillus terrigena]